MGRAMRSLSGSFVPSPKATQNARPPKQTKCTSLSAFQNCGMCSIVGWLERYQLHAVIKSAGSHLKKVFNFIIRDYTVSYNKNRADKTDSRGNQVLRLSSTTAFLQKLISVTDSRGDKNSLA